MLLERQSGPGGAGRRDGQGQPQRSRAASNVRSNRMCACVFVKAVPKFPERCVVLIPTCGCCLISPRTPGCWTASASTPASASSAGNRRILSFTSPRRQLPPAVLPRQRRSKAAHEPGAECVRACVRACVCVCVFGNSICKR